MDSNGLHTLGFGHTGLNQQTEVKLRSKRQVKKILWSEKCTHCISRLSRSLETSTIKQIILTGSFLFIPEGPDIKPIGQIH